MENKMIEYPKWIYHATEAAKIVQTKEEHEKAGKDWKEIPFAIDQEQDAKAEQSASDKAEASEDSEVKKLDLVSMTVVELKNSLILKGIKESELKGMKKDELIVMLGSMK